MLQSFVIDAIRELLAVDDVPFNIPPDRKYGDFSSAVCLSVAKKRSVKPMELADSIAKKLREESLPYIEDITASPPGFLNFHVDWIGYASQLLSEILHRQEKFGQPSVAAKTKVFVEHTSVNPNKAMHIGHLRNSVIGDTVSRILGALGNQVEVCNYIDDTGNQVMETVTALLYLDDPVYDDTGDEAAFQAVMEKIPGNIPFDDYCWDLYARFHRQLSTDERLRKRREMVMKYAHTQGHPLSLFTRLVAGKMVDAHLRTVARLNIFYHLLNWESDILNRGFWEETFDMLKDKGAIRQEKEGRNRDCWVIPLGGLVHTDEGTVSLDKILVRSDGTVVYTGKDLSYQLWKFGLLKTDFLYREWGEDYAGGTLWSTDPEGSPAGSAGLSFGHADRVINVIDTRQSYTQDVLVECLQQLGFRTEAANSVHLSYEVVNLSPVAARLMGVSEAEDGKSYAMSGREGIGVKANDFISRVTDEVQMRTNKTETASLLASAAIRYYLLKVNFEKQIAFDFDEALKTTGDTGIYLEYAHARACGILRRADDRGVSPAGDTCAVPSSLTDTEIALLRVLGDFPGELVKAGEKLAIAPLTAYGFRLATAFSDFYEHPDPDAAQQIPFIHLEDRELQRFRLTLVKAFRLVMSNLLDILGMAPLERI
jgi:arginyl-tRNA synthetase